MVYAGPASCTSALMRAEVSVREGRGTYSDRLKLEEPVAVEELDVCDLASHRREETLLLMRQT